MDATIDIPDLKARSSEERERRGGAFLFSWAKEGPLVLGAFLMVTGAAGGVAAYRSWANQVELDAVHSTVRPSVGGASKRLELASQAVKAGELKWGKETAAGAPDQFQAPLPSAEERRQAEVNEWASVLQAVTGKVRRTSASARGQSAVDQLRLTDAVSDAAARHGGLEAQASLSHDAFAQQLVTGGARPGIAVNGVTVDPSTLKAKEPAPAPQAAGKNATPYQFMLDRAYELAKEAGALKKRAPAMIAAGTALAAAGRAMMGTPGAGLAARAMIAAGLLMAGTGTKKLAQARTMLAEAKELSASVELLHGQKAQRGLTDVCLESLGRGEKLERCEPSNAGPWTELAHASQIRAEAAEAVWEVEGGKAYIRN